MFILKYKIKDLTPFRQGVIIEREIMPAFLDRLNKYNELTDVEKKTFRIWMTDLMPTGTDYNFHCEPINLRLPESFIKLWQKYPENPDPQLLPIDSLNQWRSKIADELSAEKIGYLSPTDRLLRYGSIDGKKFRTLLMDLQVLSDKEFQGINFKLPKMFIDMWKNHPENYSPNDDPISTLTEYCKRVNDEVRNPDKYSNPAGKPVLSELSNEAKESLKIPPPTLMSPTHRFLNTATFDYNLKKDMQNEFAQRVESVTAQDYALIRATNDFPIKGYHTPVNQNTRISMAESFLGPEIVAYHYRDTKHFSLNGLTEFAIGDGEWSNFDFNIIEPLADHINNPNLISLHPRRYCV